MSNKAQNFMRSKVSKKKRRYIDKKNGFDLDLSYITPHIIAMGFPSEGVEGAYRNPYSEVIRFLDTKHAGKYKVYNLCSERGYDPVKFYNRVGLFPFDDHNAPPFELIESFCADVKEFLDQDEEHLAVIHCKAGKGRTGTMICSYLIYIQEWNNTDEAMSFYAAMRTYNKKGVTIPSQIRYIRYFEQYVNAGSKYPYHGSLTLQKIVFHGAPNISKGAELGFSIIVQKSEVFKYKERKVITKEKKKKKKGTVTKEIDEELIFEVPDLSLTGDFKVEFHERVTRGLVAKVEENLLCSFWLSTYFVKDCYQSLSQPEIDKANKDKNNKTFPQGFFVEVFFEKPDGAETSQSSTSSSSTEADSTKTKVNSNAMFSELAEKAPIEEKEIEEKTLNQLVLWNSSTGDANTISCWLLNEMLSLFIPLSASTNYILTQQHEVPIMGLKSTYRYKVLVLATAELQKISLSKSKDDRLAFWFNIAHLMMLHGYVEFGIPRTNKQRFLLYRSIYYEIAGKKLSLYDIEFGILRAGMSHPDFIDGEPVVKLKKKFPKDMLVDTEPRINFVLSFGTHSYPPINIYTPETLHNTLEDCSREYLNEHVTIDTENKVIQLPKLLNWFQKDFGPKEEHVLSVASVFFTGEERDILMNPRDYKIQYKSFNWNFQYKFAHLSTLKSKLTKGLSLPSSGTSTPPNTSSPQLSVANSSDSISSKPRLEASRRASSVVMGSWRKSVSPMPSSSLGLGNSPDPRKRPTSTLHPLVPIVAPPPADQTITTTGTTLNVDTRNAAVPPQFTGAPKPKAQPPIVPPRNPGRTLSCATPVVTSTSPPKATSIPPPVSVPPPISTGPPPPKPSTAPPPKPVSVPPPVSTGPPPPKPTSVPAAVAVPPPVSATPPPKPSVPPPTVVPPNVNESSDTPNEKEEAEES